MTTMNLLWGTCVDSSSWCGFLAVNLAHPYFDGKEGVYIIWQGGGSIIRVGQGNLRDRISAHRKEQEIIVFDNLFVTWAAISIQNRNGVERYLASRLNPIIGEKFPKEAMPIEVNLPWAF